jgi:hypothetical protein
MVKQKGHLQTIENSLKAMSYNAGNIHSTLLEINLHLRRISAALVYVHMKPCLARRYELTYMSTSINRTLLHSQFHEQFAMTTI